jgi:hypothetical protein
MLYDVIVSVFTFLCPVSQCTPFSIKPTPICYFTPCNDQQLYDRRLYSQFFICILVLSIPALSKTAASILESVLRRDPHEAEFIQSIQEVVHSLEPVLVKNTQ